MGILGEFFFGCQETVEEKAGKLDGWNVKQTETGYTVNGVDADGKDATWNIDAYQANALLDHVHSVQIGDQYRQERFGLAPGEMDTSPDWVEHKHEIREYRLQVCEEESKPGWKRLLGL